MDVDSRTTLATTVLEAVLVAAMVFVAVFGIVRPVLGPGGFEFGTGPVFGAVPSVPVTLDAAAVTITTEPSLPTLEGMVEPGDGVEFLIPTGTQVSVWSPDLRQRLALVANPVLGGLLTIGVLGLLFRITHTLRVGDPFVEDNARRLYFIAVLVGIGGQVTVFIAAWGRLGILRHPDVAPFTVVDVHTTFVPLLAGFAVAVAAEVFRQGTRLRAEVAGLV